MSVVPYGAFAARKVRQNCEKQLGMNNFEGGCAPPPQKYNSKFMNSIWGMYNRYSVHNLKKNLDSTILTNQKLEINKYLDNSTDCTGSQLTI